MSKAWRVRLSLALLLLMFCWTGTVGCKTTEYRIVYVGFAPPPEEAKGAIKIAQNEPVAVTIEGKEDVYTRLNLGGYYAVSGADLKAFVGAIRETSKPPP